MCGRITRTSPPRGDRQRNLRDKVRGSRLASALQRRPEPDRRDHHLRQRGEAPRTDALGLRVAHRQGAEARSDQRTCRDLVQLTDVPGRLPTPSFVRFRSGRPFGFAGIGSTRHGEKGARLATCAIATCPPKELMPTMHDRMPVILPEGVRDRWLDPRRARLSFAGFSSRFQPKTWKPTRSPRS
jgi:hypothetical protein